MPIQSALVACRSLLLFYRTTLPYTNLQAGTNKSYISRNVFLKTAISEINTRFEGKSEDSGFFSSGGLLQIGVIYGMIDF